MISEGAKLSSFQTILAEAKRRGFSFAVAQGVYAREHGEPCPYSESPCVAAPVPAKVDDAGALPTRRGSSTPSRGASTSLATARSTWPIDFETRSRCDLKTHGSAAYAEHPSTEVLCLAYRTGAEVCLWTPLDGACPPALVAHIAAGGLLEAHNAPFEQDVWYYICHLRMGWPNVPPEQWRDSAALCAAFAIPQALGKAGAALGLTDVKDEGGHAVMMKLSKPRKPSKHNPSEWHNDPELFAQLYAYCQQDVRAESALGAALPPLSPQQLASWQATNAMNRRGIACDRDAVRGALRMVSLAEADYYRRVAEITHGLLTGEDLGSWQKVLPWCAGRGVYLPNYQKGTLVDILGNGYVMPPDVRDVLTIRLALGRTSTAKYQAMLDRCNADGRIRNTVNWHGAATGRDAGRGIQPQNLPRGHLKPEAVDNCLADMATMDLQDFQFLWGDPFAAASSCIRGCLTAGPGKTLIAADYNAIEARMLLWLAGDPGLSVFSTGRDIYKEMAAAVYGIPVEQVTPEQRALGKIAILGLGYGMGWAKFIMTCATFGIVIDEEMARRVVATYREKYAEVVKLWYAAEDAQIRAVRSGTTTEVRNGLVRYRMQGPHLKCRLPSGRLMVYPFAQVEPRDTPWGAKKDAMTYMGIDTETHQWTRQVSYGGMAVEQMDQASSCDLIMATTLRAEGRGLLPVLRVHDELVCEIDQANPATPAEFSAMMCELPAWAEGLPVAAAGWRGVRYRKG